MDINAVGTVGCAEQSGEFRKRAVLVAVHTSTRFTRE
jgi:hypothetical protein